MTIICTDDELLEDDQPVLIQLDNSVNSLDVVNCGSNNVTQQPYRPTRGRPIDSSAVVTNGTFQDTASDNGTCSTSGDEDGDKDGEYNDDEDTVSLGSYEHDHRDDFLRMQGIPCAHDMGMPHINSIFD